MTEGPRPHALGVPAEPLFARRNDVLAEICRAIARSANHRDVVQESAVRLQRYFGIHAVTLFFEQDGNLVLTGLALPDALGHLVPGIRAQWASGPLDDQRPSVQAMRQRRIVRRDASDPGLPPAAREILRMSSAGSIIAIPIYADGNPIGACVIATPEGRQLNAADEMLLEDALGVLGVVWSRGVRGEVEAERQSQAIRAHNLGVIGELASGVAHEINNPLDTIVHFAELLLQDELPAEMREPAAAIKSEALRAAATVRNLQAFARQQPDPAGPSASVGEAVLAIAALEKHRLAASNVDLRIEIPSDLPRVRLDGASLRRVLHNLVSNARHAVQETHRLGEIVVVARAEGGWVRLTVQDSGSGLSALVREAMFQPFFTTKRPGEGTGLGLAVAYGLVREHGGRIEAENWGRPPALGGKAGEGGARLIVWLRSDDRAATPDVARGAPPRPPRSGTPRRTLHILVVDDETRVAQSIAALLRRDGHRVSTEPSAEAARDVLRASDEEFDVILSDYRMPGMGGEGLFQWLRAERPELVERLAFMSGDLLSPRTHAFLQSTGRPLLAKPFTLETLRATLEPLPR